MFEMPLEIFRALVKITGGLLIRSGSLLQKLHMWQPQGENFVTILENFGRFGKDFINVSSSKATGLQRWAKNFELQTSL